MHFLSIGEKLYHYVIFILLMSVCSPDGKCQDNLQPCSIVWIKNIPGPENSGKSPFAKIIENLFLGERPEVILKPVNIFQDSNNNLWILNQGNGKAAYYRDGELNTPKCFRGANRFLPSLIAGCSPDSSVILITDSSRDMIYLVDGSSSMVEFCQKNILSRPTGIAFSQSTREIWVLEAAEHRISILSSKGVLIRRIGKRGTGKAEFNFPTHIWIDNNDHVYIVDALNFRVQIFNTAGEYLSSFGETGNVTGKFARPKGIATDSHGNIYVADALFNNIQIFSPEGILLYYFGKSGSGNGEFMMPSGIFIDDNDYIYVADSYNNRIQVFQLIEE